LVPGVRVEQAQAPNPATSGNGAKPRFIYLAQKPSDWGRTPLRRHRTVKSTLILFYLRLWAFPMA
jgi:hypothetical protein